MTADSEFMRPLVRHAGLLAALTMLALGAVMTTALVEIAMGGVTRPQIYEVL